MTAPCAWRPIFRTMFFVPVVTTTAIVGIVMTFIMSPFNGPINTIMLDLGLDRPADRFSRRSQKSHSFLSSASKYGSGWATR